MKATTGKLGPLLLGLHLLAVSGCGSRYGFEPVSAEEGAFFRDYRAIYLDIVGDPPRPSGEFLDPGTSATRNGIAFVKPRIGRAEILKKRLDRHCRRMRARLLEQDLKSGGVSLEARNRVADCEGEVIVLATLLEFATVMSADEGTLSLPTTWAAPQGHSFDFLAFHTADRQLYYASTSFTHEGIYGRTFGAFSDDGERLWTTHLNLAQMPTLLPSGGIFVIWQGDNGQRIGSLDSNGAMRWEREIDSLVGGECEVSASGNIAVVMRADHKSQRACRLAILDGVSGRTLAERGLGKHVGGCGLYGGSGAPFFAMNFKGGSLVSYNDHAQPGVTIPLEVVPHVFASGEWIYLRTEGKVEGFRGGKLIWARKTHRSVQTHSALLDGEGDLYYVESKPGNNKIIVSTDAGGEIRWRAEINGPNTGELHDGVFAQDKLWIPAYKGILSIDDAGRVSRMEFGRTSLKMASDGERYLFVADIGGLYALDLQPGTR